MTKKALFFYVWAVTLIFAVSLVKGQAAATSPGDIMAPLADSDDIQGLWVWQERWVQDPAEQDRLIDFCRKYGFNRLLVQIHKIPGPEGPTLRYPDQLVRLVTSAGDHGIAVEALDGTPDMALDANHEQTLAFLDAILSLNQRLPEDRQFAGIHYDIEPYIMPEWQDQAARQTIMLDYLRYLTAAKQKIDEQAPDLTLSVDIPFWYDHLTDPDNSAMVEFNGAEKNLHQHIQDVCDYIGIMSYRRHATGANSVVEHVTSELDYAEEIGKFVCPALETGELPDTPQISFYGTSSELFREQHHQVRQALGDRPGFGGMLTHHYDPLRRLLEQSASDPSQTPP